jgi:probable blue pigment (indigoidine) exporter
VDARLRWTLITAIAPVAWGSTYFVTHHFLPASHPLYGGAIRALPAGLALLALRRRLPRGSWWWRSGVLGVLNVGAFFALIYVAAQRLPTSLASTIMATSPVAMMLIAWALLRERPRLLTAAASLLGVLGVCLMVLTGSAGVDRAGVAASLAAMLLSALGFVLTKRWSAQHGPVDVLASTAWQLVAGGLLLLPFAVVVEGSPPAVDVRSLAGFGYLTVVATALAFSAWFTGLRHLSAGAVGMVGLLNPVTGVLLGTAVAAEVLTARQILGVALVLAGVLAAQLRPGLRPRVVLRGRSKRVIVRPDDAADAPQPDMA